MEARGEPGFLLGQPGLPGIALVGPEATLDALGGRSLGQKIGAALFLGQACGRADLGGVDKGLRGHGNVPDPCGFVIGRGNDGSGAVGTDVAAPRRVIDIAVIAETGELLARCAIPHPRGVAP